MGGEAVEDDRPLLGGGEEVAVELEWSEVGATALRLLLVAHADPDVGVEGIGLGGGGARVVGQLRPVRVFELVARRRRDHDFDPGQLAEDRQRAGDVVAVADVGEPQALELAEALAHRQQVGERLAGMVQRGQPVDHRHLRRLGQPRDGLVGAGADHDRVDVAGEDAGGVANRLAARELHLIAAEDDRVRAQLGDPDLEADPRPRRGLLEDEGDAAAGERIGVGAPLAPRFQLRRSVEQLAQLEGPELFTGEEVALQAVGYYAAMEFTVLVWNLFHGRDFPPDPKLRTWRSRLLRFDEHNETHVQVNRDLTAEFATLLAGAEWDVALLQECPPRFAEPLARACGAEWHRALTSRNSLAPLRTLLARQNPDLMASGEGGSNLTLVRVPGRLGGIAERREMAIHEGEPERRSMAFTRTASGLCLANLHATNDWPRLAEEDVLKAARAASKWAGAAPLVFGGDLNLRPGKQPRTFERLREEFGMTVTVTAPDAIDHVFCRGVEYATEPEKWPPERRELSVEGRALRLSDHAPVQARFLAPEPHLLPTPPAELR